MPLKIIYFGKGQRGVDCLEALTLAGYAIDLIVGQEPEGGLITELAKKLKVECVNPSDPNEKETEDFLRERNADLFILGGYGKILKKNIIDLPRFLCINLHGGSLPDYRGSSPMNWALINGETTFKMSIIEVDAGVDTGPVLIEREHKIEPHHTIADLHETANRVFPEMLLEVVARIKAGTLQKRIQPEKGSYYPLRFPSDGFILFDQLKSNEIHNRIRALTEPYPCAFTFYRHRKVKLLASEMAENNFYGEPGRVYKKTKKGLLICASDKCLWITKAKFEDTGESAIESAKRYDTFSTVKETVLLLQIQMNNANR